jgi:hypothetical protein
MSFDDKVLNKIYDKMWSHFKIGLMDAQIILKRMQEQGLFTLNENDDVNIDYFINNELKSYLYPNGLNRRKVMDDKNLAENNIVLNFVEEIVVGGWPLKIYFDKKNNLYWEENSGRSGVEGYRISPYLDPLKYYKLPYLNGVDDIFRNKLSN